MAEKPITQLLHEVRAGGESAMNELLPLVYDELRRLARSYMRRERSSHTLQPTALVHDAYMPLIGQGDVDFQNRAPCLRLVGGTERGGKTKRE